MSIAIRPIHPVFAGEVSGIDLTRELSPEQVQALVKANSQGRQWGVFGEPRVNVLRLNLALNALTQ